MIFRLTDTITLTLKTTNGSTDAFRELHQAPQVRLRDQPFGGRTFNGRLPASWALVHRFLAGKQELQRRSTHVTTGVLPRSFWVPFFGWISRVWPFWLRQAYIKARYEPVTSQQLIKLIGLCVQGHKGLAQDVCNFFVFTDRQQNIRHGYFRYEGNGRCYIRVFNSWLDWDPLFADRRVILVHKPETSGGSGY